VLDEPSIGLHARDNGRLLSTLETLRDSAIPFWLSSMTRRLSVAQIMWWISAPVPEKPADI